MPNDPIRTVRHAFVAVATLLLLGSAAAQFSEEPFLERPTLMSHGYGLEIMASRFLFIEELDVVEHEDAVEQVEKLVDRDLRRFEGTLTERDPELAEAFRGALEDLIEAADAGEPVADRVPEVRALHEEVYDLLIGDMAERPSYLAGVSADVLIMNDGVAEAYEDAAGDELWEYVNGWGALERIKQIWVQIEPLANEQQVADYQEMIDFLEEVVYPRVTPPDAGITGDPEEAEGATQRMIGILEVVTDTDLSPGRDMGRLTDTFLATLDDACEAYAAGNDMLGVEGVYTVRDPYRKHIRRFLELVAPPLYEGLGELTDALISDDPPTDQAAACWEVHEMLTEARTLY